MMTHNVGAMITWALFASEALNAVYDLRWAIVFCIVLIATDFWWGWRECKYHAKKAKTDEEKKKFKFHFSSAGRRTLNKFVDYTTYLLLGCAAGLAVTEPMPYNVAELVAERNAMRDEINELEEQNTLEA